ncbi:MAG: hypothetical protein AAB537_02650 [Patescibacteria group bacterium]
MKARSKVVCFVGPSGVGKTSYAKRLVEKHNFTLPTVVTTRQQRSDDDGKHYLYVTESIFIEMINSGSFLEWDRYSGHYYGTPLQSVEEMLNSGCYHGIVLDLTPDGCRKVKEKMPTTIIIALLPDDPAWLFKRLTSRNSQSPEEIQTRMNLLKSYLDDIESLICNRIYANFSPDSWDKTFEAIKQVVFES